MNARAARTKTPEQAVMDAQKRGQEVTTTTDSEGKELLQRPMALDLSRPKAQPQVKGDRVLVYHKRNTTMHLTDCKLGPFQEGYILRSDAAMPSVAPHIVAVAK